MSEIFFKSHEEEYEAASWLTALQLMQKVGEDIDRQEDVGSRLCKIALLKPNEFGNRIFTILDTQERMEGSEKLFLREVGIVSREDKIVRGFSDAAALLCQDSLAQTVLRDASFCRLMPLIDQMTNFYHQKYVVNAHVDSVRRLTQGEKIRHTRLESDFYIRQYDTV
ncbi:MAG: hypothetical protein ABJA64_03280 [Candidatus Saccharibacteria bacterium]